MAFSSTNLTVFIKVIQSKVSAGKTEQPPVHEERIMAESICLIQKHNGQAEWGRQASWGSPWFSLELL